MVRDCPRLRIDVAPRGIQAMSSAPVAALPAPPARGGGQAGRGHPRRGGRAYCYALFGWADLKLKKGE